MTAFRQHTPNRIVQIMPAPGWSLISVDDPADPDRPHREEPLVGWALDESGVIRPLVADDSIGVESVGWGCDLHCDTCDLALCPGERCRLRSPAWTDAEVVEVVAGIRSDWAIAHQKPPRGVKAPDVR